MIPININYITKRTDLEQRRAKEQAAFLERAKKHRQRQQEREVA